MWDWTHAPPALEALSFNHWTSREVLHISSFTLFMNSCVKVYSSLITKLYTLSFDICMLRFMSITSLFVVYWRHLSFVLCFFPDSTLKKLFIIYLFILLRWVFVAVCRLSRVVVSKGYSLLWCTGFSLWWLPLLQSTDSRTCGLPYLCHMSSVVVV